MKNRAMVLEAFNRPLVMREFDIPALTEGQVLVKITAAGVCGSDVHMWQGQDPRTPLPLVLGHEGVGEIVAMQGPKNTVHGEPLKAGDRILWHRSVSCGSCYYCAVRHEPWLCQSRKVYGINIPGANGCYAEYLALLPGTDIFKIDAAVDPAVLVSASCSGSTVAHAFDLQAPRYGDTVLVQGPGPLGLYAAAFAKQMGAGRVIVIGGAPNRLAACDEFGADLVLSRRQTTPEERREIILQHTHGRGVDLAIEAVGDPSAVHEGLKLVRPGGAYLSVGFSQPPGGCQVDFFQEVVRKNLRIQGVWVSSTRHTERSLQLVLKNPGLFARLVTHRFSLSAANEALAAMAARDALKAVLVP